MISYSNCYSLGVAKAKVLKPPFSCKRFERCLVGFSLCSSRVLFERLNWLPLKDEISLFKRKLIFRRIRQADCPSYITELLPRNSDSHSRVSRYANYNLMCPRYNRETEGGRTFQVDGAKLWNGIPPELRKTDIIGSFSSATTFSIVMSIEIFM